MSWNNYAQEVAELLNDCEEMTEDWLPDKYIPSARRAVSCKRWRWMPGMRSMCPHGYAYRWTGKFHQHEQNGPHDACVPRDDMLPDLMDPATQGCLLALVSEVWAENGRMWLSYGDPGWFIHVEIGGAMWPDEMYRKFPCYTEALVAALEAAP